jgi:hypothetical protein
VKTPRPHTTFPIIYAIRCPRFFPLVFQYQNWARHPRWTRLGVSLFIPDFQETIHNLQEISLYHTISTSELPSAIHESISTRILCWLAPSRDNSTNLRDRFEGRKEILSSYTWKNTISTNWTRSKQGGYEAQNFATYSPAFRFHVSLIASFGKWEMRDLIPETLLC